MASAQAAVLNAVREPLSVEPLVAHAARAEADEDLAVARVADAEKVGAGVQRVKPKDHVVLNWVPFCGSCWYYRAGKLKLDELITRRYKIAQVSEAFTAMEKGEVARGVITF